MRLGKLIFYFLRWCEARDSRHSTRTFQPRLCPLKTTVNLLNNYFLYSVPPGTGLPKWPLYAINPTSSFSTTTNFVHDNQNTRGHRNFHVLFIWCRGTKNNVNSFSTQETDLGPKSGSFTCNGTLSGHIENPTEVSVVIEGRRVREQMVVPSDLITMTVGSIIGPLVYCKVSPPLPTVLSTLLRIMRRSHSNHYLWPDLGPRLQE